MQGETILLEKSTGKPVLLVICGEDVKQIPLSGSRNFGRVSKSGSPDVPSESRVVSRHHGVFRTDGSGCFYTDLSSTNGTLLNGRMLPANTEYPLKEGDVLRVHGADDPGCALDVFLIYTAASHAGRVWQKLPLEDSAAEVVIGRNEAVSNFSEGVSRRHASFYHAKKGWAVIDHDSKNGVFINGNRIDRPQYLVPSDVISIADYLFIFRGDCLFYESERPAEEMQQVSEKPAAEVRGSVSEKPAAEARGSVSKKPAALSIWIEERSVWQRMKKKTLLKDIRIDIPEGSMVLILGGSGAGKTTFMNAVMGYEQADAVIRYKGTDIYDEYEKMKYEIGYVPQQDLMRLNDVVYETLLNAARMRLPSGLPQESYREKVEKTIEMFGLDRVRESLVGKLSGGQRKRLSIAVEYIGNPSLFFLDEPDSGLDGTMARALMENLRAIADEGKIVMVISHSPDRAFELWDRVIVLAKSSADDVGRLVFYGTPKNACTFFETDSLEKIVRRINAVTEGGEGLADTYIERFDEMRRNR